MLTACGSSEPAKPAITIDLNDQYPKCADLIGRTDIDTGDLSKSLTCVTEADSVAR